MLASVRTLLAQAIRTRETARADDLAHQAFALAHSNATSAADLAALRAQYPEARRRCQEDAACASYGEAPNAAAAAFDELLELRSSGRFEQAISQAAAARTKLEAARHPPEVSAALEEAVGRIVLHDLRDATRALPFLQRAHAILSALPVDKRVANARQRTGYAELDATPAARMASVLRALAQAHLSRRDSAAARAFADEARALFERDAPLARDGSALSEQAQIEDRLGRCEHALPMWRDAVKATATVDSAERTRALLGFAQAAARCTGDARCGDAGAQARAAYASASDDHEQLLAQNGGESYATAAEGLSEQRASGLLAFALACPDSSELRELALRAALARKGTALTLALGAAAHAPDRLAELRRALQAEYAQIARYGLPAVELEQAPDPMLYEHQRRALALERQRNALNPRDAVVTRTLAGALRAALPADQALLEYVRFRPPFAEKSAVEGARYAVFVLEAAREPRLIDLGSASEIDALISGERARIEAFVRASSRGIRLTRTARPKASAAKALYQRVLAPALAALSGQQYLHIVPDGALWLVAFAALDDGHGPVLDRELVFHAHVSSRELLRAPSTAPARGLLALAGSHYGAPAAGQLHGFPALEQTEAEARDIAALFAPGPVELWLQKRVSKQELQKRAAPGVLHVASHAWVIPAPKTSETGEAHWRDGQAPPVLPAMLRAGIALEGANRRGTDGHLTALETSALDLQATQLVLLSACDTARGEIALGEGVQGLYRAFLTAGAQSVVSSLWSVDDATTRTLMRAYYTRLLQGYDRVLALHAAMREVRSQRETRHPFFWAPFSIVGLGGALVR